MTPPKSPGKAAADDHLYEMYERLANVFQDADKNQIMHSKNKHKSSTQILREGIRALEDEYDFMKKKLVVELRKLNPQSWEKLLMVVELETADKDRDIQYVAEAVLQILGSVTHSMTKRVDDDDEFTRDTKYRKIMVVMGPAFVLAQDDPDSILLPTRWKHLSTQVPDVKRIIKQWGPPITQFVWKSFMITLPLVLKGAKIVGSRLKQALTVLDKLDDLCKMTIQPLQQEASKRWGYVTETGKFLWAVVPSAVAAYTGYNIPEPVFKVAEQGMDYAARFAGFAGRIVLPKVQDKIEQHACLIWLTALCGAYKDVTDIGPYSFHIHLIQYLCTSFGVWDSASGMWVNLKGFVANIFTSQDYLWLAIRDLNRRYDLTQKEKEANAEEIKKLYKPGGKSSSDVETARRTTEIAYGPQSLITDMFQSMFPPKDASGKKASKSPAMSRPSPLRLPPSSSALVIRNETEFNRFVDQYEHEIRNILKALYTKHMFYMTFHTDHKCDSNAVEKMLLNLNLAQNLDIQVPGFTTCTTIFARFHNLYGGRKLHEILELD